MTHSRTEGLERQAARVLSLLALLLGILFLRAGWGRWPDVLIDFGRELYVPWRLSEGEVLFRDIAWFNGPLSQYFNALLFRVFGVGFWTLAWANLVGLALVSVLLHRILARVSSPLAAGVGLCFFLAVFGCGQLLPVGNYNFISPYSHEATHGLILSLASIACLLGAGGDRRRILLGGFLLGLVFLTKAELFVAAACGVATLIVSNARGERGPAPLAFDLLTVVVGALVPPLIAFAAFAVALPADAAARCALGAWSGVFASGLMELEYYRRGMGLDEPGRHLLEMLLSFGAFALAFGPGIALAFVARRLQGGRAILLGALVFVVTLGACLAVSTPWRWMARVTPLLMLLFVGAGLLRQKRLSGDEERRWRELFGLAVFAFVLLGKIILQVRFGHYGFVLAAPAACVVLVVLVAWVPRMVREAGGKSGYALAGVLAVYTACGLNLWQRSAERFESKVLPVGFGSDAILADTRGPYVEAVLEQLEWRLDPPDELLVLPEGIMINYLARLRTPTAFVNFMPPELVLFGEGNMVEALVERPPAAVILAHRDTSEYGVRFFGRDYGQELGRWVLDNYRHRWTDPRGGPPMQSGTVFGISLLDRAP